MHVKDGVKVYQRGGVKVYHLEPLEEAPLMAFSL